MISIYKKWPLPPSSFLALWALLYPVRLFFVIDITCTDDDTIMLHPFSAGRPSVSLSLSGAATRARARALRSFVTRSVRLRRLGTATNKVVVASLYYCILVYTTCFSFVRQEFARLTCWTYFSDDGIAKDEKQRAHQPCWG